MKCPICQAEITAEDKVCPACGAPVNEAPVEETVAAQAEPEVNAAPAVFEDPGKKLGLIAMILGIAGVALGVILAGACACLGGILPAIASVAAVVLGILAMKKSKDAGFSNKQALIGIILGGAALVLIPALVALNGIIGAALGALMQNM